MSCCQLACEQARLWFTRASGEEQSDAAGRSLVKRCLAASPLDFAPAATPRALAPTWACSQAKWNPSAWPFKWKYCHKVLFIMLCKVDETLVRDHPSESYWAGLYSTVRYWEIRVKISFQNKPRKGHEQLLHFLGTYICITSPLSPR